MSPEALVPTSLLHGLWAPQKAKLRRQMAQAGYVQATRVWYHPEHWQWAPFGSGAYTGERRRAKQDGRRYVTVDEAYTPLSKAAERWLVKQRSEGGG